jgi:uronate dehydrogenase
VNSDSSDARSPERLVLVTGAAGRIGSAYAEHASNRYRLRLTDRPGSGLERLASYGDIAPADLDDLEELARVVDGVDTVVHLGADPSADATWSDVLAANIVGTYNLMLAAVAARCRRVVYASSIHAVSGYPPDVQVRTTDPVRPGDIYGVSKCFGEALGRYVADQEGVSVIAIRIGAYQPLEVATDAGAVPLHDIYVAPSDLNQLIDLCVESDVRWAVVHGISDNRAKRLDLEDTRQLLGYSPTVDFARVNPAMPDAVAERPEHNLSGGQRSGLRDDLNRLGGRPSEEARR